MRRKAGESKGGGERDGTETATLNHEKKLLRIETSDCVR